MFDTISIQIVKGGFIVETSGGVDYSREVHMTQRKVVARIKELIEEASLVPQTPADTE